MNAPLGLPMLWSGTFADVFNIHCPATGDTWALKCFTRAASGWNAIQRRVAPGVSASAAFARGDPLCSTETHSEEAETASAVRKYAIKEH
jgi:hypothetical protein